jgi:putative DNA primase/helicase
MKVTQPQLNSKHQDELKQSGLTNLSNLAYFSADRAWTKEHIGYNLEGLVIPYLDPQGMPYKCSDGKDFYRIKPEWGNLKGDETPKYLSRKDEGCRPYFPQSIDWKSVFNSRKIPIYMGEGEKKADRMAQAGYATIGLPGIYGWLDSSPRADEEDVEASRVLPELQYLAKLDIFKGREICICFDSDIMQKWQVKYALKALAGWIEEMGGYPKIVLLPTEPNREKNGADDFIVRHGEAAFAELVYHAKPAFYRDRNGKRVFNLPAEPMFVVKAALAQSVLADKWKYRPNFGWYKWQGKSWELCEDGRDSQVSIDIYKMMDANGWGHQGKGAMQDLLSKLRATLCTVDGWNPPNFIAFSNGILEITTQKFTHHSHHNLITSYLPYQYAPGLTCNQWLTSLGQALGGDAEAIGLVQAFFKWALTPKAPGKLAIECAWDLFGEPGTGKGTVLETLRNLVGRENAGTFRAKYLSNPNAAASMLDKKVSICSDSTGAIDDPGLYNEIVSNEPVLVKFLYKNIIHTTLNTFLVRAYNSVPPSPFGSQGLDRRIVAMAFKHQPAVKDRDLQRRINAELSGIFNWAWSCSEAEMVRRISTAGEIQAVKEASIQRFEENNPWFIFLSKSFPTGAELHPRTLYQRYESWSEEHGEYKLSHKKFIKAITPFGVYQKEKPRDGYLDYVIPPMKDFDIIAHLGISQSQPGSSVKLTSDSSQRTDSPPKPTNDPLPLTSQSLKSNPAIEPIHPQFSDSVGNSSEDRSLEQSSLFDAAEYGSISTSPLSADELGATGWDDLPAPKPPEIDRQLDETVLIFSRKAIAVEWESYLNVTQGVNAWKPKKVVVIGGKNTWHVRIINLTPEQIVKLKEVDTDSAPPRMPIWTR